MGWTVGSAMLFDLWSSGLCCSVENSDAHRVFLMEKDDLPCGHLVLSEVTLGRKLQFISGIIWVMLP